MTRLHHHLSLGTKFTLALLAVFVLGVAISWVILWNVLEQQAERIIQSQSLVLIETMNAVRHYTSNQVNPLLADEMDIAPEFIAQTVPAYSAREVFEQFRERESYQDFFYKEATLNPTNPRDRADTFEEAVVQRFRSESLSQLSGFREVDGQTLFYTARPLSVSSESCLACHDTSTTAPPSLITTYGTEGGFGWQLGEVIAAQMIYVPADEVFASAHTSFTAVMIAFVGLFGALLFTIHLLLRRAVIRPVTQMGTLAQQFGAGALTMSAIDARPLEHIARRGDELGQAAAVFQQMMHDVITREEALKQQVRQLTIQVNEKQQQKHVEEITETDYFQNLQSRVGELRARRNQPTTDGVDDRPQT